MSDQPDILYDDNPEFNAYLDDQYELVDIEGSQFLPSKILFNLEIDTYRIALLDYNKQLVEDFKITIKNNYPAPIAYNFHQFQHGFENNLERLHYLRDTWEALINFIHAFIISEYKCKRISLQGSGVNYSILFSDKYAEKLQTIKLLLENSCKNQLNLVSEKVFPITTIDKMKELNGVRNGFSHSATLSAEQAGNIIAETEVDVIELLMELDKLENFELIRYLGNEGSMEKIRHESYRGYAITRSIDYKTLTPVQITNYSHYYMNNKILVTDGALFICVSPFIHFSKDASGHFSHICFLKQKGRATPTPVFIFEIVGPTKKKEYPRSEFLEETNELRGLFGLPPETTPSGVI